MRKHPTKWAEIAWIIAGLVFIIATMWFGRAGNEREAWLCLAGTIGCYVAWLRAVKSGDRRDE